MILRLITKYYKILTLKYIIDKESFVFFITIIY